MKLNVIILAAGEGKRMKSALPKVLHPLAGKSLLQHVIETATKLSSTIFVICGNGKEQVQKTLSHLNVQWVVQSQQLGTGHAVMQALPHLNSDELVLILFGDVPLITLATLNDLIATAPKDGIGLLTVVESDPTGLGRVVCNAKGEVEAVIEDKDATDSQKQIKEVFTGIMVASVKQLKKWLPLVKNENAQGEYYLPDIISLARKENCPIKKLQARSCQEVKGINDRKQLAELERYYQRKQADELMLNGISIRDPNRFDVRGDVEIASDVDIDINVILEGKVTIGTNTRIAANVVLRNCQIGNNVTIKEHCIIEDSVIDEGAIIGPFARIRPESHIHKEAHIGNFVEIKKSIVGPASKVNHLSYIGDCEIGKDVNVGAGTITCNYDGAFKHKTIIEDDSFIGSGTQLVAPVTIKEGGTIGAGSTITQDTKPNQLTISRVKQVTVPNWKRPQKKETNECVES